jgi:hypothetical protein
MVRRPGDTTPDPPGGRAAERLRMYEEARGVKDVTQGSKKKRSGPNKDAPASKGVPSDEKQDRRKE